MSQATATKLHGRESERQDKLWPAQIYINDNLLANCVIKDISEGGLKLWIPEIKWVPHVFEVRSSHLPQSCMVKHRWSNGDTYGVEFVLE